MIILLCGPNLTFHTAVASDLVPISRLISRYQKRGTPLSPDNDVQVQIEAMLKDLSCNFSATWVRGHQDNTPEEELSWEAILNIKADRLATEARAETSATDITFTQFPASTKMMLYINELQIT
jgi:hypothetical protein